MKKAAILLSAIAFTLATFAQAQHIRLYTANDSDGFDGIDVHCLGAGTKILMSDNSLKNIESIQEGDTVKSYNLESGELTDSKVTKLISETHSVLFKLKFADNEIVTTADHPFFTETKVWAAIDAGKSDRKYFRELKIERLSVGDKVFLPEKNLFSEITEIERVDGEQMTYLIELFDNNNFIANGMMVRTEIEKKLSVEEKRRKEQYDSLMTVHGRLVKAHDWAGVIENDKKIAEIDKPENRAYYYCDEGFIAEYFQRDPERAIKNYKSAISLYKTSEWGYYRLGSLYYNRGLELLERAAWLYDDKQYRALRKEVFKYFKLAKSLFEKGLPYGYYNTNEFIEGLNVINSLLNTNNNLDENGRLQEIPRRLPVFGESEQ